jgi:hypothetical protein
LAIWKRRDVIGEAVIKLSSRFLHLLTQKIKRGDFFGAGVIRVDINVIADGVSGPESVNATRNQEIFRCNAFEKFLCLVEKFARLFADLRVVENRRISATQFPRVKKRRPINVFD